MEERRFDPYQFIGFILIAMILTWMLYVNKPEEGANPPVEPEKNRIKNGTEGSGPNSIKRFP